MRAFKTLAAIIVAALGFSLISAPSASAAGPEVSITKAGYLAVKVKTNVKSAVLIAPQNSDGEPVVQNKGTKRYKIKVPIPKGNSATWSVIVYDLANGEIIGHRDLTWRNWKKLAKKCDKREPVVVVKSTKAKAAYVKMVNGKSARLTLVAREDGESVFGGKRLPKKAKSMATTSPGKPKVRCL